MVIFNSYVSLPEGISGCFEVDAGKLEKDGLQHRVVGFLADSLDKAPIPTLEISLSRTYMKQRFTI